MSSRADVPDEVLAYLLVAAACNETEVIVREHRPKIRTRVSVIAPERWVGIVSPEASPLRGGPP